MKKFLLAIAVLVVVNCGNTSSIITDVAIENEETPEEEELIRIRLDDISIDAEVDLLTLEFNQFRDSDGDGIIDNEDNCELVFNPFQENICEYDIDGDYVINELDNCPTYSNWDQLDTDGDGFGAECDSDELYDWRDHGFFPSVSWDEFVGNLSERENVTWIVTFD